MTALALIQARMNSRRLPGKVLMDLYGKPVLKHVIDRVRQAKRVDEIIVCVPMVDWGCHTPLFGYCQEWTVRCFGHCSENNVLGRFAFCAQHVRGLVVRVCGDSPLVVPAAIDRLVEVAGATGADYVAYELNGQPAIAEPTGYFAEVVKASALHRLNRDLDPDDPRREHVTPGMYHQQLDSRQWAVGSFDCRWLPVPDWYWNDDCPKHTAIDTADDLVRVAEYLEDWDWKQQEPWK
jgi:spore coat polysaccharide biosynthesis protein SpsF